MEHASTSQIQRFLNYIHFERTVYQDGSMDTSILSYRHLLREIPILLQPLLHISAIPLHPSRPRPHRIQRLCQCPIEPLRALLSEKLLHLRDLLHARESAYTYLHDSAHHREARRQFLRDGLPVARQPRPERFSAFGARAETGDGEVDVLGLDCIGESEIKSALDEGRDSSPTECTQRVVFLV
jgi:hypothetical protein